MYVRLDKITLMVLLYVQEVLAHFIESRYNIEWVQDFLHIVKYAIYTH